VRFASVYRHFRDINEFMAVNEATLATTVEGRTVYPDWIELWNRSPSPANLAGWYLTDDPGDLTKWALPAVQMTPGGFLVVFASGVQQVDHPENWPYRDTKGYYHANFRLDAPVSTWPWSRPWPPRRNLRHKGCEEWVVLQRVRNLSDHVAVVLESPI
jgi:hypothetical protein